MRLAALACLALVTASPGAAIDRLIDFQQYRFGLSPTEFDYDATGPHGPVLSAGRPLWRTYVDLFAPSPKLVLIQSSGLAEADHYPIALLREVKAEDLKLAVSFKLLGGHRSMSAGLVWRARDKDNYCAVLAGGLNHDVRLLLVKNGRPAELGKAKAAFDGKDWNSLEVSAQGARIAVWLNGRLVMEARDPALALPGRTGLITHADTIAVFDDFHIQSGEGRVVRKARPGPEQSAARVMRVADLLVTDADFKTPRAAFKPGGQIYWRVRLADQNQQPVAAAAVECEMVRPEGGVLGIEKAMTGSDGTALFSRSLATEVPAGAYSIRVKGIAHSDLPEAACRPAVNPESTAKFEVR